ncbi:MAG TPA: glycosyltransferase family 2 protein [Phycisphaerae bacterium]|nr:glycosyltransferase family 2 protein [Phycisphaerae bacterium]
MPALSIAILVLVGLVGLVWTSRHLLIWRERRTGFLLTADYPGPPRDAPFVSVLVAAKDEEQNIETCVRTMLSQEYPNFEVIVCNDRSADRTGEIVARIAAEDPRVRLVNITELPEGWCGKNNAMRQGARAARGEWICMIDADCRQTSPRTLSTAVQYALDRGADLLSVLPVLEMKGFWENVVQPVCGGVMMIWFNPDKVNSPRHPHAYANGAFMLMKRSAYDAVGGHEAVRNQVNEDMHLAAITKAAGLHLRVVRNHGLYIVRMYTSLGQILRGWSRIFFGTFGTLRRLSISLAVLVFMGLLPYLGAILGFVLAAAGVGPIGLWLACGIVSAAVAAMQVSVIYRFYKLIGARKDLAWTYPIGCGVATVALVQALGKLRKGAKLVWKSTAYPSGS